MARHVSLRSLEKPGTMPGFLTRARGWPPATMLTADLQQVC